LADCGLRIADCGLRVGVWGDLPSFYKGELEGVTGFLVL